MSPPCVATIFEGDNGGSTARGVSVAEIRVGVPIGSVTPRQKAPVDALFEFVNQRFELYGRRLVPVYVAGGASSAIAARANAAEVAAQGVFAAITGTQEWGMSQAALPTELARQGIVTVVKGASTWWSDRTLYDQFHPYVWSVYPSAEDVQTNLADLVCTTLAGHPARRAGDVALRGTTRQFAVLSAGLESPPSTGSLARAIEGCTGSAPKAAALPTGSCCSLGANGRTALERFKNDGVTTVICACEAYTVAGAFSDAATVGYKPEWIFTPTYAGTGNDENLVQLARDAGQVGLPMRIDAGPRLLPQQARPWFGALQELLAAPPAGVDTYATMGMGEFVYGQLLVLASGIQGAGPQLTPDSFAQALLSMQFPNPGAGAAPYWQPSAGFGPGDHSFYDDYLVAWWSDTAAALDSPVSSKPLGSWCYLQQGKRFRPGAYPADADSQMFNPATPCR